MKLPIHPNTCACPCACIQAGETVSAERWLLIASRFHTPRKVPGSSMKNKPVAIYAISNRESRSSRAAMNSTFSGARDVFGSSARISGGMILALHFYCPREQDVVFQVHMLVQVAFEFCQRQIERLVARAGALWRFISVAQVAHVAQQVSG